MCAPDRWITPLVKQIWVVNSILFMMLGHGMVVGITSSMLPDLQAPDSTIKVTLEQASWLSAAVGVGCVVMYLLSSYSIATFGRRMAMLIGLIPAIIGPLICYFVSDINILIFGRFLSGVGMGAVGLLGSVVIGEFTSPEYRGVFLNFKSGALYFGCTIVHILGNFFHWRTVTLTIIVPYAINFVTAYTWPESPAWLASRRRYDECTEAFYWLRGKSEQSTHELTAMIKAQKEQVYEIDKTFSSAVMKYLKKFRQRNFLKPLGVYLFAAILLEMTGRHVFPAYALQIIYEMDRDKSNAFYYTLCVDLLMSFSALLSTVVVKFLKRRTLLFSSGVSSVIVLLSVCVYYYLQSKSLISQNYDAIPLFLFGSYFVLVNVGCTPICLTLIGEIFPLEHRPTGSAMAGVLVSAAMLLTLKVMPVMLATLKIYGTFTVFGASMSVCLLILYFTLPETKDKTLQEIEDYFKGNSLRHEEKLSNEEEGLFTKG